MLGPVRQTTETTRDRTLGQEPQSCELVQQTGVKPNVNHTSFMFFCVLDHVGKQEKWPKTLVYYSNNSNGNPFSKANKFC